MAYGQHSADDASRSAGEVRTNGSRRIHLVKEI